MRDLFFMDAPEGDRDARVQEWLQTCGPGHVTNFSATHAIVDPNYHPATYLRPGSRESRRPRVAVETFPIAEEVTGEGSNNAQQVEDPRNKIRRRSDDEDADADVPLPKRQATQRRLRSRDKKRIVEQKAVTGKVVARGKGWITVESGSDDK
ncbi:hypothetical protein C8R47DRAFT_1199010 [Mycena vitilis]|nr:hypothetical protein C8R47DRAFT_1199010 [Mycena vitilis]